MNVICLGDSITASAGFAECDRWPVILQGKLLAACGADYRVYNRGVGGNTVNLGFDRFATDVLPLLPGVVLIEFGYNDAYTPPHTQEPRVGIEEYERKLRAFHRMVTERGGTAVFVVSHSPHEARTTQVHGPLYATTFGRYNAKVRAIARDLSAATIDLPAAMERRRVDPDRFTTQDGLHLSVEGSHLFADMIFEGLAPLLPVAQS
jgi:lysophospholipase L1-like esterase